MSYNFYISKTHPFKKNPGFQNPVLSKPRPFKTPSFQKPRPFSKNPGFQKPRPFSKNPGFQKPRPFSKTPFILEKTVQKFQVFKNSVFFQNFRVLKIPRSKVRPFLPKSGVFIKTRFSQ